jgi:hypothetical protein
MTDIHPDFFKIQEAWWKWVNENCPSKSARARGRWMSANTFTWDGTTWTRSYTPYKSNSGKTTVDSAEIFYGADGRVIGKPPSDLGPNRRNDPDRNWGLGKE